MFTGNAYILLFFIYGLAFFTMGIASLLQSNRYESDFPLQVALPYLGGFGLIHGATEWIIMARISGLVPEFHRHLLVSGSFFNGLSFVFLWLFGAHLIYWSSYWRQILKRMPLVIYGVWVSAFIILFSYFGLDSLHWLFIEDIFSRYFIGFPGALITGIALFHHAKDTDNLMLKTVAMKMRALGFFFVLYGCLAGLVVSQKNFFPSNIINRVTFYSLLGFPVEVGRAFSAIAITILVVNLIRIFEWETKRRLDRLTQKQVIHQHRSEFGREIHDVIIQHMFVIGLQINGMISNEDDPEKEDSLKKIRHDLDWVTEQMRSYIEQGPEPIIQIEDLQHALLELSNQFKNNWDLPVEYIDKMPDFTYGTLSKQTMTQLYYIVQEALWNAFKHSGASEVKLISRSTMTSILVNVIDNGKGFDATKGDLFDQHFGLKNMEERTSSINGRLTITSNQKGTSVAITVPWEEINNE